MHESVDHIWIKIPTFGDVQEKGPDSVVYCVYGLATNVANIMVITWTIPNLTITHHIQCQYCP